MKLIFDKIFANAAYAAVCSVAVFWIGLFTPRNWFNPDCFFFAERKWENGGKIYHKFGVSKWKNSLPDMSKYANRLLLKRLSGGETADDIEALIIETCVAEAAHFCLVILSLGMVFMSCDFAGVLCAFLYALGNMQYIIIQRYNRPRLKKVLARMTRHGDCGRHSENPVALGEI